VDRHTLECSVLYAVTLYAEAAYSIASLNEDCFSSKDTRSVYNAIKSLYAASQPCDISTISAEMTRLNYDSVLFQQVQLDGRPSAPRRDTFPTLVFQLKDMQYRECLKDLGSYLENTCDPTDDIIKKAEDMISKHEVKSNIKCVKDFNEKEAFGTSGMVKTGFHFIDQYGGLDNGLLTIIAAEPAKGKTILGLCLAENMAADDGGILYLTGEMSERDLVARLIVKNTGLPWQDVKAWKFKGQAQESIANSELLKIKKMPLYIDDKTLKLSNCFNEIRELSRSIKLKGVIFDYLQLYDGTGKETNPVEKTTYVARAMQRIAHILDIPVIALSQINREVTKRTTPEPKMSDLAWSSEIEKAAANIFFLWDSEADFWITAAKHRNGPCGKYGIFVDRSRFLISNLPTKPVQPWHETTEPGGF
jgi:replicative DNA helicase